MFNVVLYEPEIPDNTGAIGRTCVALGAKLWLVEPLGFRLDNKRIKRAGLDYWPHLNFEVVENFDALGAKIQNPNFWFLTKKAETPYTNASFKPNDVFVFGSESQGLPAPLLDANSNRCLKIPLKPEARSLNISVSVGIVLFEARRQVL